MKQRLIVEGINDFHVIKNLANKRLPVIDFGFDSECRLKSFLVVAGSKEELKEKFELTFEEADIQNIGIVVDANDTGAIATWHSIKRILENEGYEDLPNEPLTDGIIILGENKPKVGVWIMPNNQASGYLEYFLANLIPTQDNLLPIVQQNVQHLLDNNLNRFTEIRRQKAEIHTWLAWQPTPGMPMGMAISANYFDCNTELATRFLTWLQAIFEFEMPQLTDNQ